MTRSVVAVLILLIPCAAFAQGSGMAFRGFKPDRAQGAGPPPGRKAVIDGRAFWTYRFEHEKETILAERIRALRGRGERPTAADVREHGLPVLFEATRHRHSWVRAAAALALGKVGGKKVVPYLLARTEHDPDSDVVESAMLGLGLTGEPEAVPVLVSALASRDRRDFAALALGLSGLEEARKPLLDAFRAAGKAERRDENFLSCLAVALGAVGTEKDVAVLAAGFGRKDDARLNVHACQALGRIGGEGARDQLLKALRDRKASAHAAGALALGSFPGPGVAHELLGKYGAMSGLTGVKNAALVSLAQWTSRTGENARATKAAGVVLAECTEAPRKNIYAAMHAALAQGQYGRRESVPYFLDALKSRNVRRMREENATAVVMALGLLREPKATARIRELMEDGPFGPDARGYCAFALGLMGDRTQVVAVREEMKKTPPHNEFLRSGCWALALLGGKEDIPFLITLLEPHPDRDKYVRGAAAVAIGLLGDRETLTELVTLAEESEHGSVRALALAAIGWLADRDPVPRLPRLFHGLLDREVVDPIREAWSQL